MQIFPGFRRAGGRLAVIVEGCDRDDNAFGGLVAGAVMATASPRFGRMA